jgi:transcriptional regulator of acetoin/glycerol metabolism
MDSSVVLAAGEMIEQEDLGLRDPLTPVASSDSEWESLNIESWERKLIEEALKRSEGSVPAASGLLGIGRATLYRKIEQFGISR